jgi:hypothetical protein
MGHTETTTRKRFYSGVRVPPMIKLPIRLVHPDDPRSAERGSRPQSPASLRPAPSWGRVVRLHRLQSLDARDRDDGLATEADAAPQVPGGQ